MKNLSNIPFPYPTATIAGNELIMLFFFLSQKYVMGWPNFKNVLMCVHKASLT